MTTATQQDLRRRSVWVVGLTLLLSGATVLLVAYHPDRILAGDPPVYRLRVEELLQGGLPYLDVPIEHLPIVLVPMFIAWWFGGAGSQAVYVVVFAGLMAASLAGTSAAFQSLGRRLQEPSAAWRWLAMITPLLPLILFRNDPFVVLLAVGSLLLWVMGTKWWGVVASLGALGKVWPAAIAGAGWFKDRVGALLVGCSGLIALALTFLPGFVERRAAVGIHVETFMGSLVALMRALSDEPVRVTLTTAAYIHVDSWVPVVNTLIGLAVVAVGGLSVLRAKGDRSRLMATGAVVIGVILTSSLFSLQYALWFMPFLALSTGRRETWLGLGVSLVTLALAWTWSHAMLEEAAFHAGVTLRNLLVLLTAGFLVREALSRND